MVCWLKFLKFVSDTLKEIEPNLLRRKRIAIDLLKEIEKEEGHDIEKIEATIKKLGKEGIKKKAKKKKKETEETEETEKEMEEIEEGSEIMESE